MLQNKVPNVRFIEYSDEWAKTKLNKIAEIVGGGTPDTKQSSYWNGGINWFSPTEVGKTVYLTKSEKTISQLGLQKSSAKLLPAFKTILFTSRAGIGDVGILTEESATNQGFQSLVVNEETDVYFLYSYSDQIKKYALKHSAGSTFLEISGKELGKMDLSIPSLPEQQAIGSLFRTLDDLLASYKDNLANYQSLKATMLSKMFPKAGQTVPEIRLDGFEGDWKEMKLGSLGSVAMNKRIFKDETSENGDIPFYKIGTFGGTADTFISKEKFKEYKEKYPYPEIGDILISASGSIGRTVVYNGEDAYYQDSNIVWLKHDQQLDNSYLQQYYGIIKWSGIEGTTIKRLYNKNILETNIFLPPSVSEQSAIGTYFSNLDNLITTHQEKISQLETLKKKLLQDMFI